MAEDRGFFSRIQSCFKDGDYAGRYMAHLLAELIREEPKLADHVFGRIGLGTEVRSGRCSIQVDSYIFYRGQRKRRADLALVPDDTNKAIALLEIKCRDFKNPGNRKHFDDYKAIAAETGCAFTILTQYVLPEKVRDARVLLVTQLAIAIERDARLSRNTLVRMFIDYVREKNLMFKTVNMDHLRILLALLFNKRKGQGTISKPAHVEGSVPDAFSTLIHNTSSVLQHITPDIALPKRFTRSINFYLEPRVKLQGDANLRERELTDREKNGGAFWTYGCFPIAMGPKPWNANLECGIVYYVDGCAKSADAVTIYAYAILYGIGADGKLRPEKFVRIPQERYREADVVESVRKAILGLVAKAESSPDRLNRQGLQAVRKLRSRLASDLRAAA